MIPARLLAIEQSESVSAVGLGQAELRAGWLPWPEETILADLFRLRSEVDELLRRDAAAVEHSLAGYPVGFCKPIRDSGLRRLLHPTEADGERPAFRAVAGFQQAGGIVKGLWGVQKGIYFQNAIQIGDLWCDLANDTVDVKRPSVEVCPLAEARFEELESFEHFARVAGVYWEAQAYPNHLFPAIAPVLPVILMDQAGGLRLAAPKTLLPRNIRLDYELATSFLGSGDFAARRLPEPVIERLARSQRARSGWFAAVPAWCAGFDPALGPPDAARLIAAEREACRGLSEAEFTRRFFDMIRCTARALNGNPGQVA
ncbi:MAG: hypothetical protein RLZZ440_1624 [Planctomycetota bacterium]|jgi:hypothetical protein